MPLPDELIHGAYAGDITGLCGSRGELSTDPTDVTCKACIEEIGKAYVTHD